jgi:hydroxycarboxylate dehydrogenase B
MVTKILEESAMATQSMVTVNAAKLEAFVADIFAKAGCSRPEADRIGRYLTIANLTGHDSHGVQRVPRYLQWKAEGQFVADRTLHTISDTPVLAVVDGQFGFGQTVAPLAVQVGIDKCKVMGLSAVALRNAGHIGRVGDWAEMAAAAGLISVHFVNAAGSSLVAPFGGVDRRFSTAPYCVGVPRPGAEPLILDFATSVVAEGKVLNASFGGKAIPDDALIDADGSTSGDPHVLYGDFDLSGPRDYRKGPGAIRAFGDHKGSGLAFMCELLGGSLTGTGATEEGRRFANGMFSFYVDPTKIDPAGFFPADVARYTAHVKSARPTKPGGEVLVPGEPERRMRAERGNHGVPLPTATWTAICDAARSVGLTEAEIKRVAA